MTKRPEGLTLRSEIIGRGDNFPPVPPGKRRRILIVDDNDDLAVAVARLLALDGYETFTAHDGHAGLEAVERHRPEVVLLDLQMPGLSGHEVCERIRATHADPHLLIVAMTGWAEEEDRNRCVDAGFDEFLLKPVSHSTLIALLG